MKITSLYEQDFNLWRETTIKQIQEQNFPAVDWEHLLLELEDMGKSEKRSFVSNLMVLLAHLLKLKIQFDAPETMKMSWYNSIDEYRTRVKQDLEDNPSFKNFLPEAINKAYNEGRKLALKEAQRAKFGVRIPPVSEYPLECPFTISEILDENFYGSNF